MLKSSLGRAQNKAPSLLRSHTFLLSTPPKGYIVFSGPRRANGVQGLRFIIQSEKAPHYLESRVEAFLHTMEKVLEDMNEEAFQKHIQALAIRRLDKPKKLSAECAKHWGEIISQQYNFDRGEATTVLLTVRLTVNYVQNVGHMCPSLLTSSVTEKAKYEVLRIVNILTAVEVNRMLPTAAKQDQLKPVIICSYATPLHCRALWSVAMATIHCNLPKTLNDGNMERLFREWW